LGAEVRATPHVGDGVIVWIQIELRSFISSTLAISPLFSISTNSGRRQKFEALKIKRHGLDIKPL
jgi:hypothetical protein